MAGVATRIKADDVIARLKGMEARGGNLAGVMRFIGGHGRGSIDETFAAGGRPQKWPPLAPATLAGFVRSRRGYRGKRGGLRKLGAQALAGRLPLTDTGRLRRSISFRASARSVTWATNVKYAAIQHFGGKAGRGRKVTIPARPYMVLQDADLAYYDRVVLNFLMTGRIG